MTILYQLTALLQNSRASLLDNACVFEIIALMNESLSYVVGVLLFVVSLAYVCLLNYIIVRHFKIKKINRYSYGALAVLGMVVLGQAWGLSQIFVPLSILAFVGQWLGFMYILRVKPKRAFQITLFWVIAMAGYVLLYQGLVWMITS